MATSPVAKRYAQALYELGTEHDALEALGEALQQMKYLFSESADLRTVLLNPAIKLSERRQIIDTVVSRVEWPPLFRNFLLVLLDKDRLRHLGDIADAYAGKLDAHFGRARATVTSAIELSDDQVQTLRSQLGDLTGKDVVVSTEVDSDLIGGVIARVGSTIYDGSVRTHMQRMREAILKEV